MAGFTTIDPQVQGPLAELLEVLGRTGDAMVAIDGSFGIIAWNEAATELLGYPADEVLGRSCQVVDAAEVLGRSASGKTLWLSASTIVPPLELRGECRLVHLIREVAFPPELERVIVERLGGSSPGTDAGDDRLDVLTPREREVLQLLTEGLDGAAIAERLFLSQATVRNHIQHILAKLGVHSRVEAVALALRRS